MRALKPRKGKLMTGEQALAEALAFEPETEDPRQTESEGWLSFRDLEVSYGTVTTSESYEHLDLATSVSKESNWTIYVGNREDARVLYPGGGSDFLPNAPLMFKILSLLGETDAETELLNQYLDEGMHILNTRFERGTNSLVHYTDARERLGPGVKVRLKEPLVNPGNYPLASCMDDPALTYFLQRVTGFQDLSKLEKIADKFNLPFRVKVGGNGPVAVGVTSKYIVRGFYLTLGVLPEQKYLVRPARTA